MPSFCTRCVSSARPTCRRAGVLARLDCRPASSVNGMTTRASCRFKHRRVSVTHGLCCLPTTGGREHVLRLSSSRARRRRETGLVCPSLVCQSSAQSLLWLGGSRVYFCSLVRLRRPRVSLRLSRGRVRSAATCSKRPTVDGSLAIGSR